MINVGIAGCGKITQVRHAPEYDANPNCTLKAVFDKQFQRAESVAGQYHAEACRSFEELLGREDLDAISICVANAAHAEYAVRALEAGKHVLCEKPMACTLKQCQEMVEASKRTGKMLVIGHNQRLLKTHQLVRKLIQNGEIGQVLTFQTAFGHSGPEAWSVNANAGTWFFDRNLAGFGVMADLGIHKLDLIEYLLDDQIVSVQAELGTLDKRGSDGNPIAVEDNAVCVAKTKKNAIGTITVSWTYYGGENNSTRIYGTKGQLRIYEDPMDSCILKKASGEEIRYRLDQIQTNENQNYTGVIDDFIEAVRTGKPSVNSGENALHAMSVLFACMESSQQKRQVEIKG